MEKEKDKKKKSNFPRIMAFILAALMLVGSLIGTVALFI